MLSEEDLEGSGQIFITKENSLISVPVGCVPRLLVFAGKCSMWDKLMEPAGFFWIKPTFSLVLLCNNIQFMLLPHGDKANTFSACRQAQGSKGKTVPGVHSEMGRKGAWHEPAWV